MDLLVKKDSRNTIFGDCAHYYLYYVDLIMERFPDAKIFCLTRDKDAVVRSYYQKVTKRALGVKYRCYRNFWQNSRGRDHSDWDKAYPKYPRELSLEEAIANYYDDYHKLVDLKIRIHPNNIRIFDTGILNSRSGVKTLLDFVEVPNKDRKYLIGLKVINRWAEVRNVDLEEKFGEKNSSTD
jgi:hypothetical protein